MQSRKYRKIYEDCYKLKIPKGYVIHHLDHNRENNEVKNLVCIPSRLHRQYHLEKRYYDYLRDQFKSDASEKIKNEYYSYYEKKDKHKEKLKRIIDRIEKYIKLRDLGQVV